MLLSRCGISTDLGDGARRLPSWLALARYCCDILGLRRPAGILSDVPVCSCCLLSIVGDIALALLLGELESTEFERPFESEGEASREESTGGAWPSSKLVTCRIDAILRGVPLEPSGARAEDGRRSEGQPCGGFNSWFARLSLSFAAPFEIVVMLEAELKLGLGDLSGSSMDSLEMLESAVPGGLGASLSPRVSLLALAFGENMSFLILGKVFQHDSCRGWPWSLKVQCLKDGNQRAVNKSGATCRAK
jgi:hypothetical protein